MSAISQERPQTEKTNIFLRINVVLKIILLPLRTVTLPKDIVSGRGGRGSHRSSTGSYTSGVLYFVKVAIHDVEPTSIVADAQNLRGHSIGATALNRFMYASKTLTDFFQSDPPRLLRALHLPPVPWKFGGGHPRFLGATWIERHHQLLSIKIHHRDKNLLIQALGIVELVAGEEIPPCSAHLAHLVVG
ncbi:hypothetical protein SELMODRAFT_418849 [Selaginella moellendorffii]|uniref:Uncharacterized protein n=1 Tax=Selaginella moellendorffii TaxID=88036 RepID=D8S703_SELML|nr:hypothetical protein SELMODRAFT_418849 [Selaginella moellendorffii]